MQNRDNKGQFTNKSDTQRKVRSIRTTDQTWEIFGDIAQQQGITRADLLEQMMIYNRVIPGKDKVVNILKDALKLKANAGGAIKNKIREVLDLI